MLSGAGRSSCARSCSRADLGVEDRLADRVVRGGVGVEHLDHVTVGVAPDPHHRMDDQVDAVPRAAQLHRHRVDDERHVVGDDLDQRVRRLPAVLLEVRVVDAHLGLARSPLLGEVPVRDRRPVQVERVAIRQILGRDPLVVLADERLARRHLVRGQPFPHAFADRVDQLGLEIRPLYRHSRPPLFLRSLVVLFASTATPRVVTGGGWQGRRTEGVPLAHRGPSDAARRRPRAARISSCLRKGPPSCVLSRNRATASTTPPNST